MQNLNHFVTYIYTYANGQKDKNAGFAKVDGRGEYIRLEAQIRKKTMEREKAELCFLVKEGDSVLAIPIGIIHFERETGNFKGRFLIKNIAETGYDFKKVTGMYVKTKTEIFASQWLEEELKISQIKPYKKQETKQETKQEIKQETKQEYKEKEILPEPAIKATEATEAAEAKDSYDWRYEWEKLEQHSGDELVFGLALWTRNKGKS